jgi:hypothetical protein
MEGKSFEGKSQERIRFEIIADRFERDESIMGQRKSEGAGVQKFRLCTICRSLEQRNAEGNETSRKAVLDFELVTNPTPLFEMRRQRRRKLVSGCDLEILNHSLQCKNPEVPGASQGHEGSGQANTAAGTAGDKTLRST